MKTLIEITSKGMPPSYKSKIQELESYLNGLYEKNGFPEDISENLRHAMTMEMEKSPGKYQDAHEIWNTRWVLDELRNIEASVIDISVALGEHNIALTEKPVEK